MKEPEPQEIEHYREVISYYWAVAECWFLGSTYHLNDLSHALSEPSRLAIKLTQNEEVKPSWVRFGNSSLDQRRHNLNKAFDQNENGARETQLTLRVTLAGIASIGHAGFTLKQWESKLEAMFDDGWGELKNTAEDRLTELGIDNASESVVLFFWESLMGLKDLPPTPNMKKSLDWDSHNRVAIFDNLCRLMLNPESAETKTFTKSMILSYLREYHNTGKSKKEIDIDDYVSTEALLNRGGNRKGSKREFEEPRDFEEIGEREALEELLGFIRNEKDKKVVKLALEYREKQYTTKQIEDDLAERYGELELGLRGYNQRLERMRDKYPDLIKRLEK